MPGDPTTDSERIEKALHALLGCVSRDRVGAWLDLPQARRLLEQLLAEREERTVSPGGSPGVSAQREVQSLRRDLSTAQQRVEALEGALRQLAEDWGNEAGRRRILALLAAKEKL